MNPQDYNQNPYVAGGQNPQNLNGQNPQAPQNWQTQQNPQPVGQFSNGQIPPVNGQAQFSNQPAQNYPQPQFQPQGIQPQYQQPQYSQPQPQPQPNSFSGEQLPQIQQNPNVVSNSTLQSQNPYTIEYLNQIAPKQEQPFWTKTKKILLGVIVGGLVLAAVMLIFFSGGTSDDQAIANFYYEVQETRAISQKYQKKLKNSEVSSINAGLSSSISSDETSLKNYITSKKIEVMKPTQLAKNEKYQKNIAPTYAKLDKSLDNGFLNADLDSVYTREMSYHLAILKTKSDSLKKRVRAKSFLEILKEVDKNLETSIQKLRNLKQ